ncbi:MAG: c-type cytochrome [Terriglobales bacterium]
MGRLCSMIREIAGPSRFRLRLTRLASVALLASLPFLNAQTRTAKPDAQSFPAATVERGKTLFAQNCAFCHGRDGGGGETGPNLMDSDLVAADMRGEKIAPVVLNGRLENGMPPFKLAPPQIADLVAFLHEQKKKVDAHPGGRRGVAVSDLQTGDAEAGKQYFNGAGSCSTCHSPTGDLAGVARRHRGLELEKRMLYPRDAVATVTVTLPSGETISGKLAYQDEFSIGLTDEAGWYHSWPVNQVKYTLHAPAEAHAELLGKYTDDDVHNLMAYLQTLR